MRRTQQKPPPLSAEVLREQLVEILLNPLQENLDEIKERLEQMAENRVSFTAKENDFAKTTSGKSNGKDEQKSQFIPLPNVITGIKGSATQAVSTAGTFMKGVTNSSFGMIFRRNVPNKVIDEEYSLQPSFYSVGDQVRQSEMGYTPLLNPGQPSYTLMTQEKTFGEASSRPSRGSPKRVTTQARHSVQSEESERGGSGDDCVVASASHVSAFSLQSPKSEGWTEAGTNPNKLSVFAHGIVNDDPTAVVMPSISVAKDQGMKRFKSITAALWFNYLIGFAILLSAILIGLQIDYKARRWTHETPEVYLILDVILCIVFIFECCMRMLSYGLRMYFQKRKRMFDFVCTCSLTIECILVWTLPSKTLFALGWLYSLFVLARVSRLARMVYFFKLLAFSAELRMLWSSLLQSIRSLFWTCILLLGIVYISSVYLTCFVAMAKLQNLERHSREERELELYFGTLDKTMMSLYQAMSEGLHWAELVTPLRKHCSPWASIFFALYIAFMLFAIMNVITAHLCEYAVKLGRRSMSDELVYDLKKLFTQKSVTGAEFTLEEFKAQLGTSEMQGILENFELTKQDALNLFEVLDPTDSGKLGMHVFVDGLQRLNGPAKATDLCNMLKQQQDFAEHIDHNLRKHLESVNEILHQQRYSPRQSHSDRSRETEKIVAGADV